MNRTRETQNFTDAIALNGAWHRAGMRYIEIRLKFDTERVSLLEIVRTLSPEDRFAVDLLPIGDDTHRPDVHGYIFLNVKEDDHQFHLGNLDHAEVSEIIAILDSTSGVLDFQATECISTKTRGRPEQSEKIRNIKKWPNQAMQPRRMLVTFRACARPAPSTRLADL
jgi:hypothetical protein